MSNENILALHKSLTGIKGFENLKYEEFESDMKNEDNRKALHQSLSQIKGFPKVDYSSFSADMGFSSPTFEVPKMYETPKEQTIGVLKPKDERALAPELEGKLDFTPKITRSTNEFDDIETGVSSPESIIKEKSTELDPLFVTSTSISEGIKKATQGFESNYVRNNTKTYTSASNYMDALV